MHNCSDHICACRDSASASLEQVSQLQGPSTPSPAPRYPLRRCPSSSQQAKSTG